MSDGLDFISEESQAAVPESGFVFVAQDSNAGGFSASPYAAQAESASGPSPLVKFNMEFRGLCEEKDAAERDARAQRKAAGKAALAQMVSDRTNVVANRKVANRTDEAARVSETEAATHDESWSRVSSLLDVHTTPVAAAAALGGEIGAAGKKGGKGDKHHHDHHKDSASGEVSEGGQRMKDVLIGLKNAPLTPGPI